MVGYNQSTKEKDFETVPETTKISSSFLRIWHNLCDKKWERNDGNPNIPISYSEPLLT